MHQLFFLNFCFYHTPRSLCTDFFVSLVASLSFSPWCCVRFVSVVVSIASSSKKSNIVYIHLDISSPLLSEFLHSQYIATVRLRPKTEQTSPFCIRLDKPPSRIGRTPSAHNQEKEGNSHDLPTHWSFRIVHSLHNTLLCRTPFPTPL